MLAQADVVEPATTELVERARDGDVAAFEQLFGTRIDRLYRVAVAILRSEADVRDQTTWAALSMTSSRLLLASGPCIIVSGAGDRRTEVQGLGLIPAALVDA